MHQDYGHYARKHSPDEKLNEKAAAELKKYTNENRINCSRAHFAAERLGISPAEAGKTLDLMEVRITGCQLGLFGHGGGNNKDGVVLPAASGMIREEIRRLSTNGRISCLDLWTAAENAGCKKVEAAFVCNKEKIKITDCQLGAF